MRTDLVGTGVDWIAGIDACKAGWFVVSARVESGVISKIETEMLPTLEALAERMGTGGLVIIDMPIGLPDRPPRIGREVDSVARRLLKGRGSSVFNSPPRACIQDGLSVSEVYDRSRESTQDGSCISPFTIGLIPKMREVDLFVRGGSRGCRVVEAHPELSFAGMRAGMEGSATPMPMEHPKKTMDGRNERLKALAWAGLDAPARRMLDDLPRGVQADDVVDAMAMFWTAIRVARGEASRIPDPPPIDGCGLAMEMWY